MEADGAASIVPEDRRPRVITVYTAALLRSAGISGAKFGDPRWEIPRRGWLLFVQRLMLSVQIPARDGLFFRAISGESGRCDVRCGLAGTVQEGRNIGGAGGTRLCLCALPGAGWLALWYRAPAGGSFDGARRP